MLGKSVLSLLMLAAAPHALSHPRGDVAGERGAAISDRQGGVCLALARDVARGAAIEAGMIERVACRNQALASFAFDRASGLVRAGRDLPAGAYLGRTYIPQSAGIRKGESLHLISSVGPVRVERSVTAMQASRGRRIFVRDAEGQVYSVPVAETGARP